MTVVTIRVQECQAGNIAENQLDKAQRGGLSVVSDTCVIKEMLALAKKRGVKVRFYGVDEDLAKKPLDMAGVKRVLEGGEP
jgi:hypothetical protein